MANSADDRLRLDDSDALIPGLTDDVALNCLARVRISADFDTLSCLNTRFNELIKSGYLYELRKQLGIVDHWLYVVFEDSVMPHWEAFDPVTKMWLSLPQIPSDPKWGQGKRPMVAGNEFLVLGMENSTAVIWKYNIVHRKWVMCGGVNYPCEYHRFTSSRYGTIAIVAGGEEKTMSNKAALYDSITGKWEMLPNMHASRHASSSFFMDGKFYVIGGIGEPVLFPLTCGEEFDLETRKWRKIEGMCMTTWKYDLCVHPPVAVVGDKLYGIDYSTRMVMKYDKEKNVWDVLGRLPVETDSVNRRWSANRRWSISFTAVGDKLMVSVENPGSEGGSLVVSAWSPGSGANDGRLNWEVLSVKKLGFPINPMHYSSVYS